MKHLRILIIIFATWSFSGCKESYDPPVVSSNDSFLVVEGALNIAGPTNLRLTKTYKLVDSARVRGELGAVVTVEGPGGSSQLLIEAGNGNYTATALTLQAGDMYRLRIKTTNGKEYLSDEMEAKLTPPISSVDWVRDGKNLQLSVSTGDPANATRYYRWEFEETWELRSNYYAEVIYIRDSNKVRNRIYPQEDISTCWSSDVSHSILLGSSAQLQNDVIRNAPLRYFEFPDVKLRVRYSVLVKQYAMTAAAYQFYELMKKNTEEIGSVFGPLPSELRGNIQCVSDPNEYVLGFVTVSSIAEKRIFIEKNDLPDWNAGSGCTTEIVGDSPSDFITKFIGMGLTPYSTKYGLTRIEGYYSSTVECTDCRSLGGNLQRPSFW
jgi:hypothetical protein